MTYGIKFCQRVLKSLQEKEDGMFEKKGHGFTKGDQDHTTELEYKGLLRRFKREKQAGLEPSYSPSIHGE